MATTILERPSAPPEALACRVIGWLGRECLMTWEWLAPTATAVVGLAGIAGTVGAATLARRTQIETARMAAVNALLQEKRALYARYLHAAEDFRDASTELLRLNEAKDAMLERLRSHLDLDDQPIPDELKAEISVLASRAEVMQRDLHASEKHLRRLRAELAVIGGTALSIIAVRLESKLTAVALGTAREDDDISGAMGYLTTAMHADVDPTNDESERLIREIAGLHK
ncbi:hypothetical protein [Micromonospora chersina]|nr:hypothetical protein [Micromonospora chersina]